MRIQLPSTKVLFRVGKTVKIVDFIDRLLANKSVLQICKSDNYANIANDVVSGLMS